MKRYSLLSDLWPLTFLYHSCGRPYIKLSHGEGSMDKGDRIHRTGTTILLTELLISASATFPFHTTTVYKLLSRVLYSWTLLSTGFANLLLSFSLSSLPVLPFLPHHWAKLYCTALAWLCVHHRNCAREDNDCMKWILLSQSGYYVCVCALQQCWMLCGRVEGFAAVMNAL